METERTAVRIPIPTTKLAEVCRRRGSRELTLFGSVLPDDFTPESDGDLLADLADDSPAAGWVLYDLLPDLEDNVFHRKVDLITCGLLSRYIRDEVMNERRIVHVAT